MSNEIKNQVAVELSETELDSVAGGQSLNLHTGSFFNQKNLGLAHATTAGPGGATTAGIVDVGSIASGAGQHLGIVN